MITCAACGAQSAAGQRFCGQCGSPLAHACPSCGTENPPENRFCGSCGTPLVAGLTPPAPVAQATIAERRLVTVLFADLVGFTSLSEHRDPEEVRDLLSRYFDRCRTLIERYGGTVEKFIGDAVMAVWGTPVAREDDAERAVRAALALTQTVTLLGEEVGMPELRVRAGVLTGNAAVELGAESEGMVLGDTVNTASRLQSIASPGTVLVDDATRRASEAAIAYEDAGTHEVKGREQPVRAWTALRVVAGAGGARRTAGLEAPFVGREHELQAVIDTGEASAHEGRARQVTIVGEPGAGKSRLLWEFFKYLDGIEELRYWHQGRCLSYGEGVAYWALAEMVRARARIQEEEDPATAREKLRSAVEEFVPDERERRLVEPRLAHLLRLEDRPDADRVDLFSGWRLFFERMAETHPVILAFEDLQWAESGLLDFIDYLLEWSADYPIFVIALGRSELRERRPSWQSLVLAPLESGEIASILEGLAPGLPDELVADIAHGAEGIPLYAVETIRMLQDRGVLTQEGSSYTVTGDVSDLDVPETLQALVASRLDGLSSAERTLLQDASVLGQSFTAAAAAAVNGMPEAEVGRILDGLVAKQVLGRDDDPRSPERGQYVFLQALLRTVAYGTLSRKARKSRHVAAARHLERTWPGEARDIAEVLASHYLEAIRTEPDADDVATLRASARDRLSAAGRAAASLALGPEAQRYFEHAAELADDDLDRAELFELAGRALRQSGDTRGAEERLRRAIELRQKRGIESGGMAAAVLASIARYAGRLDEARSLLEPFRSKDCGVGPIERAEALADLGAVLVFGGDVEAAPPLFEEALLTLELEEAWPQLAHALVARSVQLVISRRKQEGIGVLRQALALAKEHDLQGEVLRAHTNLGQIEIERDRFAEAVDELNSGLARARERGDRFWERQLIGNLMPPLTFLGRWDEAAKIGATLITGDVDLDALIGAMFMAIIASARGDESTLERCRELGAEGKDSSYVDQRACALLALGREALERGEPVEALGYSKEVIGYSAGSEGIEEALAQGIEAAIALGDTDSIGEFERFVAELPKARATPLLRAGRARLQAEMAHRERDVEAATRHEDEAIELLRSVSARPLLARTLLERHRRSGDAGALAEARLIYTELGATRWLERIDQSKEVVA